MYTIIYFSPTGNAKHLADKLAENLATDNVELLALEFTNPLNLQANDQLVLFFPVHAFNAPRTVKNFVKNLPQNLYEGVSLIGVGSSNNWMNAAASQDLKRSLKKKGYKIMTDTVLAMPLTIITNFTEELNKRLIKESTEGIVQLSKAIKVKKISQKIVKLKSRFINLLGKGESGAARLFGLELYANNNCRSCGTCYINCPQKNIKIKDNGKLSFGFNCIMCMRCIYNCKQGAISPRFSKFIPISKGYSLQKYLEENNNN